MTSVHIEQVNVDYGGPRVLDGLSLHVDSGELLAVLGASGSGKTTLLRALAGFIRPESGLIRFGDRVVAGPGAWVPPERRRVGIVPQEGALFPHLDVAGNIAFGLPRGSDARVRELLDLVGMAGLGMRRPHELSGGQQQRVALARALAPEPEVICLDEPFTALDASLRERIREDVCGILRSSGTTAILVTHDQAEALSTADRVAVVRGGRVAQVDEPRYLYRNPIDLDVARFIGGIVELRGTVSSSNRVSTAIGEVGVDGHLQPEVAGILVLRPEQVSFDRQASDGHATAVVRDVTYYGHDSIVKASLVSGELVEARIQGPSSLQRGELVSVLVSGSACFFEEGPSTAFPFPDTDLGG